MGTVSRFTKKMPTLLQNFFYATVPFSYRYGKDFRNIYTFIDKSQWWNKEKLYAYQIEQLNLLLEHAYLNVPYYHRIFDERRLAPKDIQNISDLKQLPILTRDIVCENYKDLIAQNILQSNLIKFSTSGATGNPLTFLGTNCMYKAEAAFIVRAFNAHGLQLYKEKTIWLRRYVPDIGKPIFKYDSELNRLYLSAYHLSHNSIAKYVQLINDYGGTVLVGYPSSLYILALLLEETGLCLNHVRIAHVASEKMLIEWKIKIESVLGIQIKTHYGMMEKVSMFFQCDHSDCYHESLEYGVTEFLEKDNNLQVIGTGFLNYAMPFIRYQMNDYAILNQSKKECDCRRGLPLTVRDFEGRSDDILVTSDGRYIPGVNFYTMMYKIPGIKLFQIIQHTSNNVEVKVMTSDQFTRESNRLLKRGLLERLGSIHIEINFVNEIKRSFKTGKIRCIVNEYIKNGINL